MFSFHGITSICWDCLVHQTRTGSVRTKWLAVHIHTYHRIIFHYSWILKCHYHFLTEELLTALSAIDSAYTVSLAKYFFVHIDIYVLHIYTQLCIVMRMNCTEIFKNLFMKFMWSHYFFYEFHHIFMKVRLTNVVTLMVRNSSLTWHI